jgi:hypothetical protein
MDALPSGNGGCFMTSGYRQKLCQCAMPGTRSYHWHASGLFFRVSISLIYCPPYHSKYNPIERVWAVLEKYWRREVLNSVEKALGLARTMKWNKKNPVVKLINGTYKKSTKLTQNAMKQLEKMFARLPGIEKWAVDIPCY